MATKEELEKKATDLFKRLGGLSTQDGRIVRGLLNVWKAAEAQLEAEKSVQQLNAQQAEQQADVCPNSVAGKHHWREDWEDSFCIYCGVRR